MRHLEMNMAVDGVGSLVTIQSTPLSHPIGMPTAFRDDAPVTLFWFIDMRFKHLVKQHTRTAAAAMGSVDGIFGVALRGAQQRPRPPARTVGFRWMICARKRDNLIYSDDEEDSEGSKLVDAGHP
uniref:Uncharacterized protein n=1 Tax=Mycena chlorophos TaxID=658473 RepID=A0ABQ0L6G1_MYCCL|nr:predicted protein [Mycena chlorophos]